MSKKYKILAFFLILISFSLIFGACSQKDNKIVIFESEFKNGNSNVFGGFGTIFDENDGVILSRAQNKFVGPTTYFGKNESKNSVWALKGLTAEITMQLNADIATNKSFDWTFYLNNKNNQILAEVCVCFRKYENALRVGYSKSSGEESNLNATSFENKTAKTITVSGDYILSVSFYSNIENEILYNILLKNKKNDFIFEKNGEFLQNSNNINVNKDEIGGVRSASLSYMTIDSLKVKKLRLLEN